MVKSGLKNYLKSLKYVFTPLGTMLLGFVIGMSIFVPGVYNLVNNFGTKAASIVGNVQIDVGAFWNYLVEEFMAFDWANNQSGPDGLWFENTLYKSLEALLPGYESHLEAISSLINETVSGALGLLIVLIVWTLIGAIVGSLLLKSFVKPPQEKGRRLRYFLVSLLDTFLSVGGFVLMVYLATLWGNSLYISVPVLAILYAFLSLLEAYIAFGHQRVKFKDVVNVKTLLLLLLTDLLIILITLAVLIIVFVINGAVGLFVLIPLLEIAYLDLGANAFTYVGQKSSDRGDIFEVEFKEELEVEDDIKNVDVSVDSENKD